jgi:hypothetical protein
MSFNNHNQIPKNIELVNKLWRLSTIKKGTFSMILFDISKVKRNSKHDGHSGCYEEIRYRLTFRRKIILID